MKNDKYFIDTNVLISCYDIKRRKHKAAIDFVEKSMNGEFDAFISVQILNEFARNLMNPVKTVNPLSNQMVVRILL